MPDALLQHSGNILGRIVILRKCEWNKFGSSLEHHWNILGIFLESFCCWNMFGMYIVAAYFNALFRVT
jgi:hypothetical protein